LSGVAVDAVIDSVSIATTFKTQLAELGIIFCSMSEAIKEHPELIKKWLGSVVPMTDNYFLHSTVQYQRWKFLLYSKRCEKPNGVEHLLPYQC